MYIFFYIELKLMEKRGTEKAKQGLDLFSIYAVLIDFGFCSS